jgi:hypothetical protein
LGGDNRVFADFAIVADVNKVINFTPVAILVSARSRDRWWYWPISTSSPISTIPVCGISNAGSQTHIQTVGTNHGAGVNFHAVAQTHAAV